MNRRLVTIVGAATLAFALLPTSAAHAATLAYITSTVDAGNNVVTMTITGSDGPDNISILADPWDVIKDDAGITPGPGCDQTGLPVTEVKCGWISNQPATINVSLGGGNDTMSWTAVRDVMTIDGGPGNDNLLGGTGPNVIHGGPGNDIIQGNTGNEKLYGDAGNDTIDGNWGADYVDGGPGNDTVSGGMDSDVVVGGPGNDKIIDDSGYYTIDHFYGNDILYANDGSADTITCLAGTQGGLAGRDTAYVDSHDKFTYSKTCEVIKHVVVKASAPQSITAVPRNKSAQVSWTAPATSGDYAVSKYIVASAPGNKQCSVGGSTHTCTIAGLTNGTSYRFRVHAVTKVGAGANSAYSSPVVVGAPTVVRNFSMASPTTGEVTGSWKAPASSGGGPVVRYEFSLRAFNPGTSTWTSWTAWAIVDAAHPLATSFDIANLNSGVTLQVQIRAVSKTGAGAPALASVTIS